LTTTNTNEGMNGNVKHSFRKISDWASKHFNLKHKTGTIMLVQSLDFEEGNSYELEVQAQDDRCLSDTAKVA
ncbi:PCDGA protein, partial [Steatornis caripensis]|nr:PCDGA protein [Steatornis caripensis]